MGKRGRSLDALIASGLPRHGNKVYLGAGEVTDVSSTGNTHRLPTDSGTTVVGAVSVLLGTGEVASGGVVLGSNTGLQVATSGMVAFGVGVVGGQASLGDGNIVSLSGAVCSCWLNAHSLHPSLPLSLLLPLSNTGAICLPRHALPQGSRIVAECTLGPSSLSAATLSLSLPPPPPPLRRTAR